MVRKSNAGDHRSAQAEAMKAYREPLQRKQRALREQRERKFREWIEMAKESLPSDGTPLADRLREVLDAHDEYDRQIRRLLNGEVKVPRAVSVFELGVAFGKLGIEWSSGTFALYYCGYKDEAFEILERAVSTSQNCWHIADFLKWRDVSPVEFPERSPMFRCAHATRSLIPSESEIFQSLDGVEYLRKTKELDAIGLVLAILKGDQDYPVKENIRERVASAILEEWYNENPEYLEFVKKFSILRTSQLPKFPPHVARNST